MAPTKPSAPPEHCSIKQSELLQTTKTTKTKTTNQLEFIKAEVMKAMMQHRHSLPFRKAGNELEPGSMDLATIKKKLEGGDYQSAKECIADFDLIFALCSEDKNISDATKIKAQSVENFFKAKLATMPEVEEEVDIKLKKVKEVSRLQDYMSSFFTPEQGNRSRRMTQHFDVSLCTTGGGNKRKNEEDSSRGDGKKSKKAKSLPLRSHSSESHQVVEPAQKIDPVEVVEKEEKGTLVKTHCDDLVQEISSEYISEQELETASGNRCREVESEDSCQVVTVLTSSNDDDGSSDVDWDNEDWAEQFTDNIRRFHRRSDLRSSQIRVAGEEEKELEKRVRRIRLKVNQKRDSVIMLRNVMKMKKEEVAELRKTDDC